MFLAPSDFEKQATIIINKINFINFSSGNPSILPAYQASFILMSTVTAKLQANDTVVAAYACSHLDPAFPAVALPSSRR